MTSSSRLNEQPTVSVVVPTYKSVRHIRRMIDSVRTQTFSDWELIIVDGASEDGTTEIVEEFRGRLNDRLIYIEQPNQGCCFARNTGIDAARGKFIAFLDSDDEFLPNKLERQLELFKLQPDLGLVYCDFRYIDFDGRKHESVFETHCPLARTVPFEKVGRELRVCTPDLFDYLIQQYFIATITGLVRREVLGKDIRYDVSNSYGFAEWMFYLDIVRRSRAGYVNEPLCLHHFEAGSLTRTSKIRNSVHHRRLLKTMRQRFADVSPRAGSVIRRHLFDACEQLGMQGYKQAEYGPAVRFFAEALSNRFAPVTFYHLCQSAMRWLLVMGKHGNEPILRDDPNGSRAQPVASMGECQ